VTVTGHNTVYAFGEPTTPGDATGGTDTVTAADGGVESTDERTESTQSDGSAEARPADDAHAAPSFSP
jgi:hypothetical protein